MDKPNFKKLMRLSIQTLTNFPYIEEDFDALTNYELLCKIVEELNKVSDNQKTLDNNITLLVEAFNELKNYVDNYFENLDVQEEINNKLDEMAESGQLTDIIAQYLGLAGVLAFDTVADMKTATNLVNGSICKTLGYHIINDNGGATYKVREITNEDIIDEASIIALSNITLIAELIKNNYVTPEQFGCYGDDDHDDTINFQKMLNNSINILLGVDKTYKISESLTIPDNLQMSGFGVKSMIKSYINDGTPIFSNQENFIHFNFENFYLNANNKNSIGFNFYRPYDDCIIRNIYFSGFSNSAIKIGNEEYIGQTLLLDNNIIYVSQTETIISPMIELTRMYESNITNNKILGHQVSPMNQPCLKLICCYDSNIIGNSFAHTSDCGISIVSTDNHDCRNNRILSNTYENISGDYSIKLIGTSGHEVSSTLIVEANTYYDAPRLVYCENENQGMIIGMDSTGGRRNLIIDVNSNKVLNSTGNTFVTSDNKAFSMSAIGLQGYDGKMRFRCIVNDSENADYGAFITDNRVPTWRKEIHATYEGNNKAGYRIKMVSPDGNTTKYIGIDNSGNLTTYDNPL